MDGYQFISDMTGHVVWPTVATVTLVVFRKPLAKRLGQLRSLKAGNFGAEFGEAERQVEDALQAEAERAIKQTEKAQGSTEAEGPDDAADGWLRSKTKDAEPFDGRFRDIALKANDNPSYAVVAAWTLLEDVMSSALDEIGVGRRRNARGGVALAEDLTAAGVMSPQTLEALLSLRNLRNEVAHGKTMPDPGAATGYVQSVRDIAAAIWGATLQTPRSR